MIFTILQPGTRRRTRDAPARTKEGEDEAGASAQKEKGEDHLSSEGSGSQVKLSERPTSAKGGRKMSLNKEDTSPQNPSTDKGVEETFQVSEEGITNQSPIPPSNSVPNGLV